MSSSAGGNPLEHLQYEVHILTRKKGWSGTIRIHSVETMGKYEVWRR